MSEPLPALVISDDKFPESATRFRSWDGHSWIDGVHNFRQDGRSIYDDAITLTDHVGVNATSSSVQAPPPLHPTAETMDNLDFLNLFEGSANLTVLLPGDITVTIGGISPEAIAQNCPVLSISFETSQSGHVTGSLDAPSLVVAICFLRFNYTGSYMPNWDSIDENPHCSLLAHVQLYYLAELYDVPGLQQAAYLNVVRATELSCSKPAPPHDLCDAIRYIYTNLPSQQNLIDTVINYCVNCYRYHRLGQNPEFRAMAYGMQDFVQALSRTNMERDFMDDGASDIIQLPCAPTESADAKFARQVLGDFVHEIFCTDSAGSPFSTPHFGASDPPNSVLPLRPRNDYLLVPRSSQSTAQPNQAADDAQASDDETFRGFTLVHRPRQQADTFVRSDTAAEYTGYDDSDTETLKGDLTLDSLDEGEECDEEEGGVRLPSNYTGNDSDSDWDIL